MIMMDPDASRPDLIKWRNLTSFTDHEKLVAIFCELLTWAIMQRDHVKKKLESSRVLLVNRHEELERIDERYLNSSFRNGDCFNRLGRLFMYLGGAKKSADELIDMLDIMVGKAIDPSERGDIVSELKLKDIKAILYKSGDVQSSRYNAMLEDIVLEDEECWECNNQATIQLLLETIQQASM